MLLRSPPDLVRQVFIALQGLLLRKRFLVLPELGPQPRTFLVPGSVISVPLVVFVMLVLRLLFVAPLVRFVISKEQRECLNALNVLVDSVAISEPSILFLVQLVFILTMAVQTVTYAHLVFIVGMSPLPERRC